MNIAEKLAGADPGNAGWQRDLIVSSVKLAEISAANGGLPKAAEHYHAALTTAEALAANGRLAPADAWMIDDLKQRLATTGQR